MSSSLCPFTRQGVLSRTGDRSGCTVFTTHGGFTSVPIGAKTTCRGNSSGNQYRDERRDLRPMPS